MRHQCRKHLIQNSNPKKKVKNSKTMKLLTHNMLSSKCLKGVQVGYPLKLTATDVRECDVDFNPDFVARLIPKLDWNVLVKTADTIGKNDNLPKELVKEHEHDNDFLKKVHHVLLEIDIVTGEMTCPETGRVFPINNGIPNMLLNEDEV